MRETLFRDAMVSLRRNRTRTLLSGASVAGGVFILLFSMAGFNVFYNGKMGEVSKMNLETVAVSALPTTKSYLGFGYGREWTLHKSDIEDLLSKFPSTITGAGPVYCFPTPQLVQTGDGERKYASVLATHPEVCDLMQMSMSNGRFIDEFDMQHQRKVCVIGLDLSEQWFGDKENPCGKDIMVGNVLYTIVGVIKKENPFVKSFGNEQKSVLLPYTTADAVYGLNGALSSLLFSLNTTKGFEQKKDEILCYLRQLHQVAPDDISATFAKGVQEYAQILDTLFRGTRILIWVVFIGIIISSLLGVFGIMLLSVRERQVETAVRLSMGALPQDIIRQFVQEGLIISVLSSMIGLLLAELTIAGIRFLFLNGIIKDPLFGLPQLPFAGILAVIATVIVGGFLSGYLPARKMTGKNVSVLLNDIN